MLFEHLECGASCGALIRRRLVKCARSSEARAEGGEQACYRCWAAVGTIVHGDKETSTSTATAPARAAALAAAAALTAAALAATTVVATTIPAAAVASAA